jgi:energy-coupling factor transport system permease protein
MDIMFGQYANIKTTLHKLHPVTKLFGLIIFIIVTFLYSDLFAYVVQLMLLVLLLFWTKVPLRVVGRSLWNIRYLFVFLFIFNLLFIRDGTPLWQWGFIGIYPRALLLSVNLLLRVVLLTTYSVVFTLTTNPLDLSTAISNLFAFLGNGAHIFGMILAIALRFMPTLQSEANKIMKAQRSRGARFVSGTLLQRAKDVVTLLVPLLVIAFTRADTLAVAMELRGYDPNEARSQFRTLRWRRQDTFVCLLLCIYLIVAIIVRIK